MKRNGEELRVEAAGYHKRQPYAVMVAVLFLPFESCDDAKKAGPSSFGSWVKSLRPLSGRARPEHEIDTFEKVYVALYEQDASKIEFFDVEEAPPRNSRPVDALSLEEFLAAIYDAYLRRNHAEFTWADGVVDPVDIASLTIDDDGDDP